MRYARLLHDFHWMRYKSRTVSPGWAGLRATPETVPIFRRPSYSDKDDVRLGAHWEKYLQELNTARGFKFIMWPPAGWFNKNKYADSLGFGGNVVAITEVVNGFGKINAFNVADMPPDASTFNFHSHPELIQKFTVITKKGTVINPANGIDVYTFLIGYGDLYVPLDRVEFFPELPIEVTVNTGLSSLNAHDGPDEKTAVVGKFNPSQTISIYDYAPRGTHVWGRSHEGWVLLSSYPKENNFKHFTSWKMKTRPPVPPKVTAKKGTSKIYTAEEALLEELA